MKLRDLIKAVEQAGWKLERTRGSHRQFRHPDKPQAGTLTIAGHPSAEVPKGTLNAILKQAGLKNE
ncbi:MAG TPA: type II toxin-antitoxin system HicA family toxin [Bryobacteraceae bacterium]|nr:type II toxin-antitoxin system HicA family toxin [Bryobacteraceae bacterium]